MIPSTFIGGPRHMVERYHDAMAIVRATSKLDLFITMTCNPSWPEILRECAKYGQNPQDRPDIVARCFRLKLLQLLKDLLKSNILGRPVAHFYVIEFQKRGLPHAHILIILCPDDKPRTPNAIDSIVCTELPELFESVTAHMLHSPCGRANTGAACMTKSNGQYCDRRFPKRFCNDTTLNDDGYPMYRRRDDGRSVEKHGFLFTNQHVVP